MHTKTTSLDLTVLKDHPITSLDAEPATFQAGNTFFKLRQEVAGYPVHHPEKIEDWLNSLLKKNKPVPDLHDEFYLSLLKLTLLNRASKGEFDDEFVAHYEEEMEDLYEFIQKKFEAKKAEKIKADEEKRAEEIRKRKSMTPKEKKAEKVRKLIHESAVIARKGYAALEKEQEKKDYEDLRPIYLEGYVDNELYQVAEEKVQQVVKRFAESLLRFKKAQIRAHETGDMADDLRLDPALSRLMVQHTEKERKAGWELLNYQLMQSGQLAKQNTIADNILCYWRKTRED